MQRNLAQVYPDPSRPGNDPGPGAVWPDPDMSVLDAGRRDPPLLPSAMFGSAWPEFGKLAGDKGAPVDYVALSFLTVAASIVGGKRRVRPYAEGSWSEPPIIWLGLVGDPSHNKSPALDPLQTLLRKVEAEKALDHRETLAVWQADCERAKVEHANWQSQVKEAAKEGHPTPALPTEARTPDQPRRRRLLVQDATPESMGEVLVGNPAGTLLLRDELDGWLSSFDRYNPGGRSFWLEAFGGRSFTIDRKSNPEPLTIGFNGVSIIGGIQPQKLAESLLSGAKADDGLSARFLWTWPDRPALVRPRSTANILALENALRRLEGVEWGIGEDGEPVACTLPLDPDAADVFEACQRGNRDHGDEAAGMLKSFVGKLDGMSLRLALVVELVAWAFAGGPEPRSVSKSTMEAVGDFIESYALPMAARVFGDAALPPVERNAATLAKHIQRHKPRSINARDLRRTSRLPGMREAEPLREAIDALVEADWLRPSGERRGSTPGRHSADFIVNPVICGGSNA
jgi:hypothetical protein